MLNVKSDAVTTHHLNLTLVFCKKPYVIRTVCAPLCNDPEAEPKLIMKRTRTDCLSI